MVTEKSWEDFRGTGLLLFVNFFLHIFGWSIVVEIDNDKILRAYPARVKFRGFDDKSTSEAYIKLSEYMIENANILKNESEE